MPDEFRKVQPGEPLSISAQQFNTFVDTARIVRNQQTNQGREPFRAIDQPSIVLVKNSAGEDLDRFHVLGLKQTLITPADNEQEFQNRVAFDGEKPDLAEHYGRFVVLAEPLKDGKIGRAYISGVCPVKLSVDDGSYKFADMRHDDTGSLQACIVGSARILWKEPGTGEKWGVVRLSNADPQVYALDDCRNQKPTLFVVNDLADNLGEVVKVFDTCYEVRPPACSETKALDPIVVPIAGTYADCDRCLNCWKLTRCDDNQIIRYANNDLAEQENRVVKLDDDYCYLVELSSSCTSAESVTVKEDYSDCDTCSKCYQLENCHDESDTLVVENDLSKTSQKSGPDMVTDGDVFEIDGKCYQVMAYETDCTGAVVAENPKHFQDCQYCGCFKLTECDVAEPEILYAHAATDTDFEPVTLRDYVGEVIRLENGTCYLVEESQDCNSTSEVTVLEAYADCTACVCYTLTECGTSNTILTYTDLSGLGFELGDVIRVPAEEKCYTITSTASWDGSAAAIEPEEQAFEDCDACTKARKFKLANDCQHEDCGGGEGGKPEIITTEDLHDAVGQYVKVEGHCYQVAETATGDVSDEELEYQGPFGSCQACQEQPVTSRKRFVARVFLDADQIKAEVEEMILEDGAVTGFCALEDEVIGDYCCEGNSSSSGA